MLPIQSIQVDITCCICSGDGLKPGLLLFLKINTNSFMIFKFNCYTLITTGMERGGQERNFFFNSVSNLLILYWRHNIILHVSPLKYEYFLLINLVIHAIDKHP